MILKKKKGRPQGSGPYNYNALLSLRLDKTDLVLLREAHRLTSRRGGDYAIDKKGNTITYNQRLVIILRDWYSNVLSGKEYENGKRKTE